MQQVVNEPKSYLPDVWIEAETEARRTEELKQRELFEAQLEQQRQKEFNAAHLEAQRRAAQAAQAAQVPQPSPEQSPSTGCQQPSADDAAMPDTDPFVERDPWSKDKHNERVLKKRMSDEGDMGDAPAAAAGSDCWANMNRLLHHNTAKLEQSLDLKLAAIWNMTIMVRLSWDPASMR